MVNPGKGGHPRYYPTAEITSHLLGFTDIDDVGQEGLELGLNERLQGVPGSKRVIRDRLGQPGRVGMAHIFLSTPAGTVGRAHPSVPGMG